MSTLYYESSISHHGIKGQKWGVRRFQNPDGSLTRAGQVRYGGQPSTIMGDANGTRVKAPNVTLSPEEQKVFVKSLQRDILDNNMGDVPYRTRTAIGLANTIIDNDDNLKSALTDYKNVLSREHDFYTDDNAVVSTFAKRYGKDSSVKTAADVFSRIDGTEKFELFLDHEFYSKIRNRGNAEDAIDDYYTKREQADDTYEIQKLTFVHDNTVLTNCLGDRKNEILKTPSHHYDTKWTVDRIVRQAIDDQMDERLVKQGYW